MRKKCSLMIALTFALCLLFVFSILSASAALKVGDVDGDNDVTIIDATVIQQYLAQITNLSDEQIEAAKVCGQDNLSIIDATTIQLYLARVISAFPAEHMTVAPTTEVTQMVTQKPTQVATQPAPTQQPTEINKTVDLYFTNNKGWSTVYAYIYNYQTSANDSAFPGKALSKYSTNEYGESVYKVTVDSNKFDRIIFSNGAYEQTTDTPVTVANSGYFLLTDSYGNYQKSGKKFVLGVYPYSATGEGSIKQVNLTYSSGYSKRVTIWTPNGYNAADKSKKYSVLYMTDGQNLFGNDENGAYYEWECDETVLSMMKNTGDGIIVVGIDNANSKRDSELTPDIGPVISSEASNFSNGTGKAFCKFVTDTVVPYIDSNYNTNSHRGIAGSSSGGLEAFYIGIENQDKFDYIGALSPAFMLFSQNTWASYLNKLDFSDTANLARIYFYNGKGDDLENQLYPSSVAMQSWLNSRGYPSSLMKTVSDNDATHNEKFWAVYFPEMLSFGLSYSN